MPGRSSKEKKSVSSTPPIIARSSSLPTQLRLLLVVRRRLKVDGKKKSKYCSKLEPPETALGPAGGNSLWTKSIISPNTTGSDPTGGGNRPFAATPNNQTTSPFSAPGTPNYQVRPSFSQLLTGNWLRVMDLI
ncbi:hypothetical protein Fcan01_03861 [Folsomia candida]|uniref:Uncharacterized protein n=1 Tax=Folsomia candida TaxID=158441 RepID=A0A226EXN0_FOLCA|nr:hypothetical protein Fcan01_03861 [Folsomia candida]